MLGVVILAGAGALALYEGAKVLANKYQVAKVLAAQKKAQCPNGGDPCGLPGQPMPPDGFFCHNGCTAPKVSNVNVPTTFAINSAIPDLTAASIAVGEPSPDIEGYHKCTCPVGSKCAC